MGPTPRSGEWSKARGNIDGYNSLREQAENRAKGRGWTLDFDGSIVIPHGTPPYPANTENLGITTEHDGKERDEVKELVTGNGGYITPEVDTTTPGFGGSGTRPNIPNNTGGIPIRPQSIDDHIMRSESGDDYRENLSNTQNEIINKWLGQATKGRIRRRHGHFENTEDIVGIIKDPVEVFVSEGKRQRIIFYDGENVVIMGTNQSEKGWVVTEYGPKGSVNRANVGDKVNTDRGAPVSRDDIINGTIPSASGTIPPARSVWKKPKG